ncbi:MAG: hypothetical protein ACYSTF_00235 [Planctomycetota bacterium]|jgi:hypothetical protein
MTPAELVRTAWAGQSAATCSAQSISYEIGVKHAELFSEQGLLSVTASAQSLGNVEPELVPYECSRSSGLLDFWEDPAEDIYTSEDGTPL